MRLQLCWASFGRVTHDALEIADAIASNATHTAAVPSVVSPPLDHAHWKALNAIQLATWYTYIYTQYTEPYLHHRTTCSTLDCIASRGTQTHWKSAMYTCCVPHMRQHTLRWSEKTDHHACNCVYSCAGPIPAVSHMMHWKSPMRSHQTQRTRRQCQVWSHHGWATPIGKR